MTEIKNLNELRDIIKMKEQLDEIQSIESFSIMLIENELLTSIIKKYAEYNYDDDLLYEANLMEAIRSRVSHIDDEEEYYKAILQNLRNDYWFGGIFQCTSLIYTSLLTMTIHSSHLDNDAKQYGISKLLSENVDFSFLENDDYAQKLLTGNNTFMEKYSGHISQME